MTREETDGRVELTGDLSGSPLYNHDLAPTPIAARTWRAVNLAGLWVAMCLCIPTYQMASGLIAVGMNVGQAVATILLGNLIVLVPILLNSHPGTRYGIPFPVFARASYGTVGANLPALMRALVACGWFGINAWIGGMALDTMIRAFWPGWATWGATVGGYPPGQWVAFAAFWALNMLVVFRGMEALRRFGNISAVLVLAMTFGLYFWTVKATGSWGPGLTAGGRLNDVASFLPVFIPSLTAIIGFWATLSLNMPDFTRFAASQRDQVRGQVTSLPAAMVAFSTLGILITSQSGVLFGKEIWDPIVLVGKFGNPWVVAFATLTIALATTSVNVAANVVSPANDFAHVWPSRIDFRRGALITGVLGIVIQPWRLLSDASAYIFDWLGFYAGGLGAVAGVLVWDYWVLRRTRLSLADLYSPDGAYSYRGGWHPAALLATVIGCFLAWGGRLIPAMAPVVPYGWFAGFFGAAFAYHLLARASALGATLETGLPETPSAPGQPSLPPADV
ncbi:MAG: NCS1 family nucleobase:cation symporter-1 [Candidatus Sericytochromatia bacterium]|nr:NCS1 family nucleobase:cation symporter-1 [Candidatus Sericytochromatia bacterium]